MPPADHAPASAPARPPTGGVDPAGVSERLRWIRDHVARAAARAGRPAHAVTIVAVSKNFGVDSIRAALAAGQQVFGESKAQELSSKAAELGDQVRWHFVGRLQRNKVRQVVGVARLIHAVDRVELAEAIAGRASRQGRVQPVLVQVNVGDDPAKGGCGADETLALVEQVRELPGILCQGLMTIPPLDADPRPLYRRLRVLRDTAQERFPEVAHLSMGMSRDYEVAVEEGATMVRVGEALFGPRPAPPARRAGVPNPD